ncbi:MAG: hypothetical protein U9Q22_04780 [Candidatus Altiarchaeota archaeon]|nr:hypothetical protein [Candidatus Altiarchaeota archaeon]
MVIPPLLIQLLFGAFIIVALYMLYLNISKKEKKTFQAMLPIYVWAFVIVLIILILLWSMPLY